MQNRQHTELTTDQSPSRARQIVAWLTLIAYIGQPMAATAQVIAAQNAAAQNRPVIDNTANGIPLVQIVAPNAAGISHNQFTQYNVDPSGLILNNSNAAVQTQQAGYVSANPNMAGGTARIILNEVTSTSQSQLNGYTEVAGTRAEVIIANPNGINCNGCGFINTSRGVLTTGTPVFGGAGSLDSFRVTGGLITVGSGGLIDSSTDQLDLIARSVKVNDTLWANNNLNVITGTNQVNYANLGVQVITGDANKPTVGIDVSQLGGMYANKIRLLGTEAGVGVNSQGTLAAQAGDFTLDNQGQITLAGAASASGNLTITGVAGTTNSGTLYSEQNLLITDHGVIANSGILSARGNLTLDGASISSSGTLGAGIAKDGTVVLTDGTDTRQGVMKLIATNQIDATGQNIAGTGLSMAGTTINLTNSQAMVGGGGATLTATDGDITNDGGTFQSLGSLTLNAAGGVVGNAGGTFASALDTTVTTNTVTGTGKIIAGRDATINIKGDYTNALGNVIQANRDLTFTTTGAFTNLATLESLNKLTLNASNLDNRASAIINAGDTTLNIGTGSITNAGRIEGNTVAATSDSFANTGTVIGDNLTLNANSITNSGASAIIAGTQSVNLAVKNSLLNQGGAVIYSYLGDINIGAGLTQDANGFLIGNTGSVTNSSSTIEAGGNLRISANQLINERTIVGVVMGPETSTSVVTGTLGSPGVLGDPSYTAHYADETFAQGTTDAGQLLAGTNMRLNTATVTNNYSDIIAGQTLQINGKVNNIGDPFKQQMTVTNGTRELWSYVATGWHWGVKCNWKGCWPTRVTDYGWTHQAVYWTQAASVSTPATNPTQYTKAVDPTLVIGKRSDSQTSLNKASVPNGSGATLTVPANGLYTIHNQPGQPYLVVTDPRFANYQNYVSSDYMLSRLALDPGMIEKRLGDGFYEQKLVTDQVTQLTGRRYLGQSASAEEQFKALMLSGVAVAKEFKLIPGVGLTKEQMAALTTDIVWLVEQTVALPSGGTTKVLAPQVYLSQLHAGDLKPSGALLAAEAIDINTAGSALTNTGTIRSTTATNIAAQDIMNLGGTIGSNGTINLQAVNDIVNRSGKIAGNNVNLTAGRDVINERTAKETTTTVVATTSKNGLFGTTQSPVAGNGSNTELGLETGITAADGLNITAGRDISIIAANFKAGGNASLNAAENITVGTIAVQQKNTGAYNAYINTVTNQTSQIDIGGNLDMKAGNNLQITAAKVNTGKDLTLQAGGNIDLKAAKNSTAFGYDSGVAQESKYDETVLGTTLKAGGNVTLVATRMNGDAAPAGSVGNPTGRTDGKGNITLEATQLQSQGATTLVADNNIDIKTADEAHTHELAISTQSQGVITTTTTTTHSSSSDTIAVGSSLSGDSIAIRAGNAEVTGGEHGSESAGAIVIKGSSLTAKNELSIAGGSLSVLAANESSYREESVATKGMLSSKKTQTKHAESHNVASVLSGKNISLSATAGDMQIIGSKVKAEDSLDLASVGSIDVRAGYNGLLDEQRTEKSGWFSGGSLFSKESALDGNLAKTAVLAELSGGKQLTINAGKNLALQGVAVQAASISATAQNIDIENVADEKTVYSKHEKMSVSFGDAAKALSDPRGIVKTKNGKASVTLGKASYDMADKTTTTSTVVASSLSGDNISLNASGNEGEGGNISITGSNLKAANDLTLAASGDVSIKDAKNTESTKSKEQSGKAEVNFVVKNEYVEIATAIQAARASEKALKQSKEAYNHYKTDLASQEQKLAELKQSLRDGKLGIDQSDVNELQGYINDLKSDEQYYKANIALAATDLATKTAAIATQVATAAASSGTYGFNAGIELNVDMLEKQYSELKQQSVASNLDAKNISINAGKNTTIQGSNLKAANDINIDTKQLDILAAEDINTSQSSSEHKNATISYTVYGGVSASAGADQSQNDNNSITHTNSTLNGANINLKARDSTTIAGANIAAAERLSLETAQLTVASVQDSQKSHSTSTGINLSGGSGGISGGGANAAVSRSQSKQTVLTTLSGGSVDINVTGNTTLTGATIAAVDADGNDTGNLSLKTGSLQVNALSNTRSSNAVSANIGLGRTVSIDASADSSHSKTKTLGTIGNGDIQIADAEKSDTRLLNRDTKDNEVDIYNIESHKGLKGSLDTRFLSKQGRTQIAEDLMKSGMVANTIKLIATTDKVGVEDFFSETDKSNKTYEAVKQKIAQDPNLAAMLQDPNLSAQDKEAMLNQVTGAVMEKLGYAATENKIVAQDDPRKGFYSEETGNAYINDTNNSSSGDLVNTAGHEMAHAMDDQSGDNTQYSKADRETYASNYGSNFTNYTDMALDINGYDGGMASSNNHVGNSSAYVQANNQKYDGLNKENGDDRQVISIRGGDVSKAVDSYNDKVPDSEKPFKGQDLEQYTAVYQELVDKNIKELSAIAKEDPEKFEQAMAAALGQEAVDNIMKKDGKLEQKQISLLQEYGRAVVNKLQSEEFDTSIVSLPAAIKQLDNETKTKIFDSGQKDAVLQSITKDYIPGEQIILQGHSAGGGDVQDLAEMLQDKGVGNVITVQIDSIEPFGNDASIPSNVVKAVNAYQAESKTGVGWLDAIYSDAMNGEDSIHRGWFNSSTNIVNKKFTDVTGPSSGLPNSPHRNIDNDHSVQKFIQEQVLPEVKKDIEVQKNETK